MSPPRAGVDPRALRRALVVLAAAWLVLFAPQLIARQVFVLGAARVYRPFSEFSRERWLEHHERTFWNPYVMTGVAASASLADMRPQYLPDAALDLFERVRPGRFVPLAAPLLAHLLGMWAMAALAWALWAPATVALVWAGLAWGLSPMILVPLAYGHHAYLMAASLLPGMWLAANAVAAALTLERSVARDYPGGSSASVRWLRDEPDELAFAVDCAAPTFLVVADAWFPGWSGRLDRAPVPLWRVDHSLRGIAIPAGHHELRMTYRPEGWDAGVRITRASSLAWLLAALAWLVLPLGRGRLPAPAGLQAPTPVAETGSRRGPGRRRG